jgi:hypothetical protein
LFAIIGGLSFLLIGIFVTESGQFCHWSSCTDFGRFGPFLGAALMLFGVLIIASELRKRVRRKTGKPEGRGSH